MVKHGGGGALRVIGGRWKHRLLQAPAGMATRPLTDRIKQALFDWLGDMAEVTCVDCCAGSGTFAIEAVSRGAAIAHLIEPDRTAQAAITANLATLGNPAELRLHRCGFQIALPTLQDLDLAFCDPPFPWWQQQPALLAELLRLGAASLGPNGVLVLRGESDSLAAPWPSGWGAVEQRDYGRSRVWLGRRHTA